MYMVPTEALLTSTAARGAAVHEAVHDRWAWADRGSCVDQADLFYNSEDESKGVRRRKEETAKSICQQCPVLAECRSHAMAQRELYGVWGGLSENDRHRLAGRLRTG